MFDFAVKGSVVGFNTSADGTKTFVKVQPAVSPTGLQRDERPGLLDVLVNPTAIKNMAMQSIVTVRGKAIVLLREARDKDGKQRLFTNYRFEAETIEPAKA